MKRTYRPVKVRGMVECRIDGGTFISVPLLPGILKHPGPGELAALLADPAVLRKYTREALRKAPWSALRRFPRAWLRELLPDADLPDGRRRALEYLLGP